MRVVTSFSGHDDERCGAPWRARVLAADGRVLFAVARQDTAAAARAVAEAWLAGSSRQPPARNPPRPRAAKLAVVGPGDEQPPPSRQS